MKVSFASVFLEYYHPFRLSGVSRNGTDCVIVRIQHNSRTGYGEATLPPYLTETPGIVIDQLRKFNELIQDKDPLPGMIHSLLPDAGLFPATRCALEEALLLCGKEYSPQEEIKDPPRCTYTIGIGSEAEDRLKIEGSKDFHVLKVKLGKDDDPVRMKRIRRLTDKTLCVDLNQGYSSRAQALELACELADLGVIFMEQPFAKDDYESHAWLRTKSPVPVIADESVQNMDDLLKFGTSFDGINVKLIKAGGPAAAENMLIKAKEKELYRVIGCMSESSCGVYHAAHLQHLADITDLDGPWLIRNDPFSGVILQEGRLKTKKLELIRELHFEEL